MFHLDEEKNFKMKIKPQNLQNAYISFRKQGKNMAPACNFTKSNTPPWTFFKLYNGTKSHKAPHIVILIFRNKNSFSQ